MLKLKAHFTTTPRVYKGLQLDPNSVKMDVEVFCPWVPHAAVSCVLYASIGPEKSQFQLKGAGAPQYFWLERNLYQTLH